METRICKTCGKEFPFLEFSKNAHGYTDVCRYCANEKRRLTRQRNKEKKAVDIENEIHDARSKRLQDFTPRELIEELVRRGYTGNLTFTKIEKIDLSNF